jgi:hypothetical protein
LSTASLRELAAELVDGSRFASCDRRKLWGVIGICPLAATSDCPEAANPVTERGEDGFEQVQIPVVLV